jgi:LSD1 subclass zinc finger protein
MNSSLTVSTECPTCGAPLDFSEGSNAIQCLHCHTHLLVTGRKQLLTYAIIPKIDDKGAIKRVRLVQADSHTPPRVVKAELYFVPYYRMTGHDFLWERTDPPSELNPSEGLSPLVQPLTLPDSETSRPFSRDSYRGVPMIVRGAIYLIEMIFKFAFKEKESASLDAKEEVSRPAPILPKGMILEKKRNLPDCSDEITFRDRYVEKNFLACHLEELSLYSLGVRPAVLRSVLFHQEELEKQGKIVGVGLAPDAALAQGMKAADSQKILYRQVIGQMLSVVYFPFWVIEMEKKGEERLQIVDAVSEKVIQLDAPLSAYKGLNERSAGPTDVIDFRPLTCPNCGWDLAAKAEDVIFFCSSCEKAWQIRGKYLYETSYSIAEGGASPEPVTYLPFWVLETEIELQTERGRGGIARMDQPSRYFIPAFRYRRLKMLSDLARRISQKQPAYSVLTTSKPALHGCYYDQEDAARLAEFIHAGSDEKSLEETHLKKRSFHVKDATLTWFPFAEKAGGLVDPFTGFSLPKNLLL